MDSAEVKALIEAKLVEATTSNRVSAFKAMKAAEVAIVDDATAAQLEKIVDEQVKHKGKITKSTALFVDKSPSMTQALEVGKRIAAIISGITEAQLFVYAFDTYSYPVIAQGKELSDWEKAFKPLCISGGTSIGVALETMRLHQEAVEQIIIVTDEGENTSPYFNLVYPRYCEELKVSPNVVIVKVGNHSNYIEMVNGDMSHETRF